MRFDVFVACSEHERAQGCPIRGDRAFRLFQAENDTPSNFVGWCDQTPSNFSVVFTSDCVAFVMGRGAGPGRNGEKEEIHLVHAPAGGVVQEDSTSTGDYPTSDRRRIEGRRTELGRDRGQSEESFVGQSEEEIEETTDEEASSSSGSEEEEDEEESKKNSVFYSVSSPSSGEDGSSSPLLPQGSAGSGEQAPSGAAVTSSSTKCAPTLNTVIQSILSDPILPLGDWLAPGETEQSYPTHRILNDLLDEHGDFLKPFLGKSCPKVLTVHAPPKHRLVLPQDIVDESSDEDGTTRKQVEKAGSGGGGSSKRIRPPITVLSEDSRMVGFKWRSGLISEETVWYGRAGVGDGKHFFRIGFLRWNFASVRRTSRTSCSEHVRQEETSDEKHLTMTLLLPALRTSSPPRRLRDVLPLRRFDENARPLCPALACASRSRTTRQDFECVHRRWARPPARGGDGTGLHPRNQRRPP